MTPAVRALPIVLASVVVACASRQADVAATQATASLRVAVTTPEPIEPSAPCPDLWNTVFRESPTKTSYSVDGYLARTMLFAGDRYEDVHCIVVLWPPGSENGVGKPSDVARHIDEAWFVAIENTLRRIPWQHLTTLHRVVIDNQPLLHGLGAFDRNDPLDGRDGHTIWLNEHLFRDDDHWVHANVGSYFSYHTNRPGERFDDAAPDHDLFSPVLLHEVGHIVMYNLINPQGEAAATPECARSCGDLDEGCKGLSDSQQEANCISPYCRPHGYPGSTENWAEQYRFFYQSTKTRALLSEAGVGCGAVLGEHDTWPSVTGAWPFGLPDDAKFEPSRWDSCGKRACKAW
jgi:hypothetical protein